MITCRHCGSDDIALQESQVIQSDVTKSYRFKVWSCIFMCHTCGQEFAQDLDDEDRKEYL